MRAFAAIVANAKMRQHASDGNGSSVDTGGIRKMMRRSEVVAAHSGTLFA